ncbi:AAA family ATPase, partial [Anaerobiospirillum succiniciproducens]|uniref:AAA family ATPase n=1 Tax=Anaerobiospirillum succiniciproducens TaxID=13335 RepID=UPI0029422756
MTMRYITAGKILSFDEMIDKTTVYVDKTQAVCLMASQKDDILLTRPRRMGKSTMVSTLEYLFSK